MRTMRLLLYLMLALASSAFGQSLTYTPRAVAAYMSPDGTNWNPLTTAGGYGLLAYTPYAVGLYCQTAANAAWSPCVFSGGSSGVSSFNSRTGAVTPQTGDYTASQVGAAPATNPTGGANNYAAIASPTFTGTPTTPSLTLSDTGGNPVTITNLTSGGIDSVNLTGTSGQRTQVNLSGVGIYSGYVITESGGNNVGIYEANGNALIYTNNSLALSMSSNTAIFSGAVVGTKYHETLTTPASSSAACSAGDFTDDANFHYVCTATNTWKRVALSTF